MTSDFKIYVADLAAYNNGKLHGVWIDAMSDDIQEQINDMLKLSPEGFSDEWAIHDYDGFGDVSLSEFQSIDSVRDIACFLYEYDEFGAALLYYWNNDLEDAKKAVEDDYHGLYDSLADYAQAITEDTTEIPTHISYYIDYERLARDMEMNGDVYILEMGYQKVHIFSHH